MEISELQELLLKITPQWHYWVGKPFKSLLDDHISLSMYYCIQTLKEHDETLNMSELALFTHNSKQQITKTVDRLIEHKFAERISDPNDRRIIRLKLTQKGKDYTTHFLSENAGCYQNMFENMTPEEHQDFYHALQTLHDCFCNMHQRKFRSEKEASKKQIRKDECE